MMKFLNFLVSSVNCARTDWSMLRSTVKRLHANVYTVKRESEGEREREREREREKEREREREREERERERERNSEGVMHFSLTRVRSANLGDGINQAGHLRASRLGKSL